MDVLYLAFISLKVYDIRMLTGEDLRTYDMVSRFS